MPPWQLSVVIRQVCCSCGLWWGGITIAARNPSGGSLILGSWVYVRPYFRATLTTTYLFHLGSKSARLPGDNDQRHGMVGGTEYRSVLVVRSQPSQDKASSPLLSNGRLAGWLAGIRYRSSIHPRTHDPEHHRHNANRGRATMQMLS